jgi:hypothetical protein
LFAILFALVFPAFFAYVIYSSHVPLSAWNADIWTGAALIPASAAIGCLTFWVTRIRWQFTETEIIALKPGRIAWRLAHGEITAFEIRQPAWWLRILWVQFAKGKYPILISDPQLARSIDAPAA